MSVLCKINTIIQKNKIYIFIYPEKMTSWPGASSMQQATSLPGGGQPTKEDTKTWGVFIC